MAVPKSRDFLVPILNYLNEKDVPLSKKELNDFAFDYFKPSEEDLEFKHPSKEQPYFFYRIDWARTHLKKAELIEYVKKGVYQITDFGKEFLQEYPEFNEVTLKEQIPAYKAWLESSKKSTQNHSEETDNSVLEEENNGTMILEVEEYHESVEADILDRLKNMGTHTVDKGTRFEEICLELLVKMGYGNAERTGGSGDRGIDGFLTTDHFGFDRIGIQCKCFSDGKITDDQITKFAHGLKNVNGLNKGIFITTTDFMPSAKKVVEELKDIKIILINGSQLAKYMMKYQVGVEVSQTNYVYDILI
ncbi:MAG: restriction endonuclease [Brevinema sp.]